MSPWEKLIASLEKIKKLTPEQKAALLKAKAKGGDIRNVLDDFLTGMGDEVRGGVKKVWSKHAPEAVAKGASKKATSAAAGTLWESDPAATGTLWEAPWAAAEREAAGASARGASTVAGQVGAKTAGWGSKAAGSVGRGLGAAARGAGTGLGAAWKVGSPWLKTIGKAGLVGLGGAGAVMTLLELPGMISDGLDIAEDAGLDPRRRKAPLKAALRNRLAIESSDAMQGAGELGMLERVNSHLGTVEGAHKGMGYGTLSEGDASKLAVLQELPFLRAHQGELMAIQKKAALQDAFESAAQRILRS